MGHILVVDDDHRLREVLCDALELEGYKVVAAEHGQAALEHLQAGDRPCLILLDLMMPVMDGKAFREEMLKDPDLADIPVVLITAGGAQVIADVPVVAVLCKPLSVEAVVDVVQAHCC
jgi:CheY-like chemotaxis protein